MKNLHRLEDITWGAGATRLCRMESLPPGKRIRELLLHAELSGTKDSADALDGQAYAAAYALLKLNPYVNISGFDLQQLDHQVYGRVISDPTDIPGSGTTFAIYFDLRIPFRDPRQPHADDGSLPTDLLRERSLECTFGSATVYATGNIAITAGTVQVYAELTDEQEIPQINQIGYEDPGSLTWHPKEGVYKDLFVTDAGAGTITAAEIATVDFDADGKTVMNNVTHRGLVSSYNGQIRDSAGEVAPNAATRLPLVWHDSFGKANISKQVLIETSGRVQLTGTITTPRYVYWRAMPKDNAAVDKLARVTNAPPDATEYQPKTATKTELMKAKGASGVKSTKQRVLESVLSGKVRKPGLRR